VFNAGSAQRNAGIGFALSDSASIALRSINATLRNDRPLQSAIAVRHVEHHMSGRLAFPPRGVPCSALKSSRPHAGEPA
jgi:hypothetical protein